MSLYTNKQRWKRVLLGVAGLIVVATLGYSNHIAGRIRQEEKRKVAMWSMAIQQRAALVSYTQMLFEELEAEERTKADRLAQAYQILTNPGGYEDLTFVTGFVWSNTSIPVVVYNGKGDYQFRVNVPDEWDPDSLRKEMARAHKPIVFEGEGTTVYWSESVRLSELKRVMGDLIGSFISETVINSASVPVILMDSTRTRAVRFQGVDSAWVRNSVLLQQVLVPVSSGGVAAGVASAIKLRRPDIRVVGVQPERANAYYVSRQAGRPTAIDYWDSMADGLSAVRPGERPFAHLQTHMDDVVLISEADIAAAFRHAGVPCTVSAS